MLTTAEILQKLEKTGLVPDDVVANLRQQVVRHPDRFNPEGVIKWLVTSGLVTQLQADRLLRDGATAPPTGNETRLAMDNLRTPAPPPSDDDLLQTVPMEGGKPSASKAWSTGDDDLELLPPTEPPRAAKGPAADSGRPTIPVAPTSPPRQPPPPAPSHSIVDAEILDEDDLMDTPPAGFVPAQAPRSTGRENPGVPSSASTGKPPAAKPTTNRTPASKPSTSGAWRDDSTPAALPPGKPPRGTAHRSVGQQHGQPLDLFAAAAVPPTPNARRKAAKSVWDTPLLLFGGGGLLLLVIIGVALYFGVARQSGDQALAEAEQSYAAGSYTQAVALYDAYLQKHAQHTGASMARVHRGLAQLRQTVEGARNWPPVLEKAQQLVPELAKETDFAASSEDLAALLPRIAEGLAEQAEAKRDPQLLKLSRDALAMTEKYVPSTLRPNEKLQVIESTLSLAARRLERADALDKGLADIQAAVKNAKTDGQLSAAYEIRAQLIKTFPDLAPDESLRKAIAAVTAAEQESVRFQAVDIAAATTEIESPLAGTVVLAKQSAAPAVAALQNQIHLVLAEGAVHALDAANGAVLWRRYVGYDTNFVPQLSADTEQSTVLLVDAVNRALLSVDARSGALIWRQSLEADFVSRPVITSSRIYWTTAAGQLLAFNKADGKQIQQYQMQSPLQAGPGVDENRSLNFLAAQHSNLYVLGAEGGSCREAFYLGHEPGTIAVPPLSVSRYVLVAENRGVADSVLRVLLTNEAGVELEQVQEIPLGGHVLTPISMAGRLLIVSTDRGAIHTFEVGAPGKGLPLKPVADKPIETGPVDTGPIDTGPTLIRYPLVVNSALWVAGTNLTRYKLQTAGGRLTGETVLFPGDTFLQPPVLNQGHLLVVRRRANQPGVVASALDATTGNTTWETELAVPLTGGLVASPDNNVWALNQTGKLFKVTTEQRAKNLVNGAPAAELPSSDHLSGAIQTGLEDGRAVATVPGKSPFVTLLDPQGNGTLTQQQLPDTLAAAPLAFRGGLLVALQHGQLAVINPATGEALLQPFQPRLEVGTTFAWNAPARAGENVIVSDGELKLYQLTVADSPQPNLAMLNQRDLITPLASPLAVVGDVCCGVDQNGVLHGFALADLASGASVELGGAALWGPMTFDDKVLVATVNGELHCLNSRLEPLWKIPLAAGNLAGAPILDDGSLLLATRQGRLSRHDVNSGAEQQFWSVGQPLATGPLVVGDQVIVGGHDGTILSINK